MIYPRPQDCYLIIVTESSRFHPDPDDEENIIPMRKNTTVEHVVFSRHLANTLAKEYFIRQHCESDSDANEDDFGRPTPRAGKWGIWVPSNTTKCTISELDLCCKIEVILDDVEDGLGRIEFLVEVLREEVCDAKKPMASDDVVRHLPLYDSFQWVKLILSRISSTEDGEYHCCFTPEKPKVGTDIRRDACYSVVNVVKENKGEGPRSQK